MLFSQILNSKAYLDFGDLPNISTFLLGDWKSNYKDLLLLAYQSFGVVYGDLGTSPIYVCTSSISGRLNNYHDEQQYLVYCP